MHNNRAISFLYIKQLNICNAKLEKTCGSLLKEFIGLSPIFISVLTIISIIGPKELEF